MYKENFQIESFPTATVEALLPHIRYKLLVWKVNKVGIVGRPTESAWFEVLTTDFNERNQPNQSKSFFFYLKQSLNIFSIFFLQFFFVLIKRQLLIMHNFICKQQNIFDLC